MFAHKKTHKHQPTSMGLELEIQKEHLYAEYHATAATEELKQLSEAKNILSAADINIDRLLKRRDTLTESEDLKKNALDIRKEFNALSADKAKLFPGRDPGFLDHYFKSELKPYESIETRAYTVVQRIQLEIKIKNEALKKANSEIEKEAKTYQQKLEALEREHGITPPRPQAEAAVERSAFLQPNSAGAGSSHPPKRESKRENPFAKVGQQIAQSRLPDPERKGPRKAYQ